MTDFTVYPDLAVRSLGGSVVWANDESFAERENLLRPGPAEHDPTWFGHKGKVYDGWESRRRRDPGHDEAIVRLGVPGVVDGVVVDTAWFKGNFPPEVSVEAVCRDGYPSVDELRNAGWESIVPRSPVKGDAENSFEVDSDRRWTHVRLSIYPDGGVARLRVHGRPLPDPRILDALSVIDLAALENGAYVTECSDMFYGSPTNVISPGRSRVMGEGWETARRRDDGNDWVVVRLAGRGVVRLAEVDTSYFIGNAPAEVALWGRDGEAEWFALMPPTRVQPDTRHRFLLDADRPVTHVRTDLYPDGGLARLLLVGRLDRVGRSELGLAWFNALPDEAAGLVLREAALPSWDADALVAARPVQDLDAQSPVVRRLLAGP